MTGHELYQCARGTGHTNKFVFNGLPAATGHFYFTCA